MQDSLTDPANYDIIATLKAQTKICQGNLLSVFTRQHGKGSTMMLLLVIIIPFTLAIAAYYRSTERKLTVLDGLGLDVAIVVGDDGGLAVLGRDHGALLACMQHR